jgi:two-component system, LytTR family, response regulator
MHKIKALVADDEILSREGIALLLADDADIEVIGVCADADSAYDIILKHQPDILFLDIHMPGMNGFELLESLQIEKRPLVIFITAYDHFASHAFEVDAIDYIVKPFNNDRFYKAVAKVKKQLGQLSTWDINNRLNNIIAKLENSPTSETTPVRKYFERMMVKTGDRMFLVKVKDVDWFEAQDYYIAIHTGKETHLIRKTMAQLETELDPSHFIRIHRSTIVNINKVKTISAHFNNESVVLLEDGTKLKMSQAYKAKLQQALAL